MLDHEVERRRSGMGLARGLETLLVAAVVAALAPVVVALLPGPRIPQVVVLLAGGVLIGPEVLGWTERPAIDLLANVGLGFLFLLAGYELDLQLFRERPGRLAMVAWLVTVALAAATVGALAAVGFVNAFVPVALGLTTTAFGTLLPILREGEGSTAQTIVRLTVLLLLLLLVIAEEFGLDVVLGAFLAGMVLRRWAPGGYRALEGKLDAIGYGFFIPLFFVSSGMALDIRSIAEAPLRLLVFLVLMLVVRGVPALFLYRGDLPPAQRVQTMFLTATALPLLVALAEIGLRNGTMLRENAAALVGRGLAHRGLSNPVSLPRFPPHAP